MGLKKLMKDSGYSESQNHPIYGVERTIWYKRTEGRHQVEVIRHNGLPDLSACLDVSMTYETRGGFWVTTTFYGLTLQQLETQLCVLETRLVCGMRSMGANPLHYRFDEEAE